LNISITGDDQLRDPKQHILNTGLFENCFAAEHTLYITMLQHCLTATRLVLDGEALQIQLRNLPAPLKIMTNSKSKNVWGTKTCEQQGAIAKDPDQKMAHTTRSLSSLTAGRPA